MISLDRESPWGHIEMPMYSALEIACGVAGGFSVLKSLRDRDLKKVGQLVQLAAILVFTSEVSFHHRHTGLKPVPLYGRVFLIGQASQISIEAGLKFTKFCFKARDEDLGFEEDRHQEISRRELEEIVYLSCVATFLVTAILMLGTLEVELEHRRTFGMLNYI